MSVCCSSWRGSVANLSFSSAAALSMSPVRYDSVVSARLMRDTASANLS
jgi:hypothetical protein